MKRISNFIFPALMLCGVLISAFVIVTSLQAATASPPAPAHVQVAAASNSTELAAQGRALFVAKGCIVCHRNDDLATVRRAQGELDFGDVPDLSNVKIDAAYLKRWLQDPTAIKPSTAMPNLHLSANEIDALAAYLTRARDAASSCPVTELSAQTFVPPAPYPAQPSFGGFWYGTEKLWTALQPGGQWNALPKDRDGYSQKIVWWRLGYEGTTEQQPALKITGKQLDGVGTFVVNGATNAYSPDFGGNGWAIMSGVEIPALGCWEITGEYGGQKLSFVVQVTP